MIIAHPAVVESPEEQAIEVPIKVVAEEVKTPRNKSVKKTASKSSVKEHSQSDTIEIKVLSPVKALPVTKKAPSKKAAPAKESTPEVVSPVKTPNLRRSASPKKESPVKPVEVVAKSPVK